VRLLWAVPLTPSLDDASPLLRLYDYPASPNCYKARLALAELGLDYDRVHVDIFGGDTLADDFAAKNPARTTPVLEVQDGEYLVESNAILLYLTEGTPLLPDDKRERAEVYRWLFFEQARVVPFIGGLRFRLRTGRAASDSEDVRRQTRIGMAIAAMLDEHLEDREYFVANRYTVADLCLYGYMHAAGDAGIELASYPRLEAWLDRVRGRPGHVADLEGFPANARPGSSKSIYDLFEI
jgi:glutathione S-transferase